jgi:GNAT superfamily N-acetyltransferase
MLIRPAMLVDLNACLALDADSQTNYVWQMEERDDNGSISVRFQTVHLPRVMRVAYPRQRDDLLSCWENGSVILIATERPAAEPDDEESEIIVSEEPTPVYGYCQLDPALWQGLAWINHLIVDRRFRRHGIGAALLAACIAWSKHKGLERLMVAVQTKNYPGISFCQKHGFGFCGFNEHHFPNRDIALLFALKI